MKSGLYHNLVRNNLLIPHKEVKSVPFQSKQAYKIIQPEPVSFISYPYEWCFSQLKNAAFATLEIQKKALEYEMSLKDASAYNIQFCENQPALIDTLSFEKYKKGKPWVAYRQFCQHFLAPLALMSHTDIHLNKLAAIFIDGIPLDLASKLLPFKTRFNFSLFLHIHMHSKTQERFSDKHLHEKYKSQKTMSELSMHGLIDSLKTAIKKMKYNPDKSHWVNYYKDNNYYSKSFEHKKQIVGDFLKKTKPEIVWDMGANTGVFSRIACGSGVHVIAFDMDPDVVEINYRECIKNKETYLLPLVIDLNNPSPNIGWANTERMTLMERGPGDTVMALALLHHLAVSNNLGFSKIAEFFSSICKSLIIEFIPKDDSQVQRLLSSREDIFPDYNQKYFEKIFRNYFHIKESGKIKDSKRIIYLMKNRKLK